MRDLSDPDVLPYLEAENEYLRAQAAHLAGAEEEIFADVSARTSESNSSAPHFREHAGVGYWYYQREVAGAEHPLYCRARGRPDVVPTADPRGLPAEEVLLDVNKVAEGKEFLAVEGTAVSPDGTVLAYAADETGDERYQIRFVDLSNGDQLSDVVEGACPDLAWAKEGQLFYARPDASWRPCEVWRHTLGKDAADDVRVLIEPDDSYWATVSASRDGGWIVIRLASLVTSEVHLVPTSDPEAAPSLVAARRQDVAYTVEPAGDRLLVLHNDGAEDFCLATCPLPGKGDPEWTAVMPHQPGVRLDDVVAYRDHVAVGLRRDGLPAVHILPRSSDGSLGDGHDVRFDEPLFKAWPAREAAYDAPFVRLGYTSLLTPMSTYDYDTEEARLHLRARAWVPDHPTRGPFEPNDYVQVREWATADDGALVPISIVRRKDTPLDGTAPAVLYGYGAYEVSIDLMFQPHVIAYLDRGFVYAFAHVRGGGEMGRRWYIDGKLRRKVNTFTDFITCARRLGELGYTSRDRLAAVSNSAGGLLLGAVANRAPADFRAVFAEAPFVDALTTLLMPEAPLTVLEWEEWGNPYHDPGDYTYIKRYSPYENVVEQEYPAILITSSIHDTRVSYVEMTKWIAALRHLATNDPATRPFVLKTEMHGGHSGASGRYRRMRDTAFEMAWLIDQLTGDHVPSERGGGVDTRTIER